MVRAAAMLTFAVIAATPAFATPLEDRLREQLQATVTELRSLQSSQAALEAAKAGAEKERDALKAKGGAKPADARELAAAKNQNTALGARLGSAQSELAAANARAAELSTRLGAAQAEMAQLRTAASGATASSTATAATLKMCVERNESLVKTGRELVTLHQKRYGKGDFPPLQILRTRIENEAQAMGDRVSADAIVVNAGAEPQK
jgi:chromosome segregation ATPase